MIKRLLRNVWLLFFIIAIFIFLFSTYQTITFSSIGAPQFAVYSIGPLLIIGSSYLHLNYVTKLFFNSNNNLPRDCCSLHQTSWNARRVWALLIISGNHKLLFFLVCINMAYKFENEKNNHQYSFSILYFLFDYSFSWFFKWHTK